METEVFAQRYALVAAHATIGLDGRPVSATAACPVIGRPTATAKKAR